MYLNITETLACIEYWIHFVEFWDEMEMPEMALRAEARVKCYQHHLRKLIA